MQVEWFEDYARKLLEEKGVKLDDEAVMNQLVTDLATRARDYVLKRLLNTLSEQELIELETAMDANDGNKGSALLDSKKDEVARAMGSFRSMYLGLS